MNIQEGKISSIIVKDRDNPISSATITITVGEYLDKKETKNLDNTKVLKIYEDKKRDCYLVKTERPDPYFYGKGEVIKIFVE